MPTTKKLVHLRILASGPTSTPSSLWHQAGAVRGRFWRKLFWVRFWRGSGREEKRSGWVGRGGGGGGGGEGGGRSRRHRPTAHQSVPSSEPVGLRETQLLLSVALLPKPHTRLFIVVIVGASWLQKLGEKTRLTSDLV